MILSTVQTKRSGANGGKASSDDPNSPPLTPSMLLTSRNNQTSLPPGIFEERDTLTRRWWRQLQYLSDVFCKRWLREYLPALQCRSKWTNTSSNLKPNDLVLVVDESTSRGNWPLGVVDSVPWSIYTTSRHKDPHGERTCRRYIHPCSTSTKILASSCSLSRTENNKKLRDLS